MKPQVPLKYCSVAFAVMWSGWMFWLSGPHDIVNLVIWAVAGTIVGYLWYLGMRWWFQRIKLLPRDGAKPSSP